MLASSAYLTMKSGSTKRGWKKPLDAPKQPLSAYNLFYKHERQIILAERSSAVAANPDVYPGERRVKSITQRIAEKWNNIDETTRRQFESLAAKDRARYAQEKAEWKFKFIEASYSAASSVDSSVEGKESTPPEIQPPSSSLNFQPNDWSTPVDHSATFELRRSVEEPVNVFWANESKNHFGLSEERNVENSGWSLMDVSKSSIDGGISSLSNETQLPHTRDIGSPLSAFRPVHNSPLHVDRSDPSGMKTENDMTGRSGGLDQDNEYRVLVRGYAGYSAEVGNAMNNLNESTQWQTQPWEDDENGVLNRRLHHDSISALELCTGCDQVCSLCLCPFPMMNFPAQPSSIIELASHLDNESIAFLKRALC